MPEFTRSAYCSGYEVEVEFDEDFQVAPEDFIAECDTSDAIATVRYGLGTLDADDIQSVVNQVSMETREYLSEALGIALPEYHDVVVNETQNPTPAARSTPPQHITELTKEEIAALPEDTKNTLRSLLGLEINPYVAPEPEPVEVRTHPMLKVIIDALEPDARLHHSLIAEMRRLAV